jgi:large subunit ribosomal protein L13
MKTYSVKASEIKRDWHLIDADGVILGKVATEAARLLMGKHKPIFSRHLDTGDYVVVVNAAKVAVSGGKEDKKIYYHHTGYMGGIKDVTLGVMLEKKPLWVMEHAIKGMLPKNRLGRAMLKKLKIYASTEHPHNSQLGSQ